MGRTSFGTRSIDSAQNNLRAANLPVFNLLCDKLAPCADASPEATHGANWSSSIGSPSPRETCVPLQHCPDNAIDAVSLADVRSELVPMLWGLIPGWWKKTPRRCHRHSTRGQRPSPKSRCSVRPLNVPAASCQHPAITSGERSRESSNPISSAQRMARCYRSRALG